MSATRILPALSITNRSSIQNLSCFYSTTSQFKPKHVFYRTYQYAVRSYSEGCGSGFSEGKIQFFRRSGPVFPKGRIWVFRGVGSSFPKDRIWFFRRVGSLNGRIQFFRMVGSSFPEGSDPVFPKGRARFLVSKIP